MAFTQLFMDFRDGVSNDNTLGTGASMYNPPSWRWEASSSANLATAGTSSNAYSTIVKVGYYNLTPSGRNDNTYVEISLPSTFPTGNYYVYFYGEGYSTETVGYRIDNGAVTLVTVGTLGWKRAGAASLTKDNKIRFSVGVGTSGMNLYTIAIVTADNAPNNIPTGQAGIVYTNNYFYPNTTFAQIYAVDATNQVDLYSLITNTAGATRSNVPVTRLSSLGQVYTTGCCNTKLTHVGTNSQTVQPYWEFDNSIAKYSTMFVTSYNSSWSATDSLDSIQLENPSTGEIYNMSGLNVLTGMVAGNGGGYGNVIACGVPGLSTWNKVRIKFSNINNNYIQAFVGFKSIDTGFLFPWEPSLRYLVEDGTNIKKFIPGTGWSVVGTTPITENMFKTDGMKYPVLSALGSTDYAGLISNNITIRRYYNINAETPRTLTLNAPTKPHIILPTGDISLLSASAVKGFTITGTQTGGGVVLLIASIDGGITWKAFGGGVWVTTDSTSLTDTKAKGMTMTAFNAISQTDWNTLIGTSTTIRFGYYLELTAVADVANTDTLTATFDMLGRWKTAFPVTDYDYEYSSNTQMNVFLYTDGTYKINY